MSLRHSFRTLTRRIELLAQARHQSEHDLLLPGQLFDERGPLDDILVSSWSRPPRPARPAGRRSPGANEPGRGCAPPLAMTIGQTRARGRSDTTRPASRPCEAARFLARGPAGLARKTPGLSEPCRSCAWASCAARSGRVQLLGRGIGIAGLRARSSVSACAASRLAQQRIRVAPFFDQLQPLRPMPGHLAPDRLERRLDLLRITKERHDAFDPPQKGVRPRPKLFQHRHGPQRIGGQHRARLGSIPRRRPPALPGRAPSASPAF